MLDLKELDLDDLEKQLNTRLDNPISWQSAALTHPGNIRHINEDAYLDCHQEGLWIVADGLGGHSRGDYASNAVIKAFSDYVRKPSLAEAINDIHDRLIQVNHQCQTAFRNKKIGTTVALLIEYAGSAILIWAGDSRIYRLRENELLLMTSDHSLAQEKLDRGEITPEELQNHPQAHTLTRAVGVHKELKLSCELTDIKPGDRFLICSDGLYNDMTLPEMLPLLQITNPEEAIQKLVDYALEVGGRDNITAIIAHADQ